MNIDSVWSYCQPHLTIICHISKHNTVNYGFNTSNCKADNEARADRREGGREGGWDRDMLKCSELKYLSIVSSFVWLPAFWLSCNVHYAVTQRVFKKCCSLYHQAMQIGLTGRNFTMKRSRSLFCFQWWYVGLYCCQQLTCEYMVSYTKWRF